MKFQPSSATAELTVEEETVQTVTTLTVTPNPAPFGADITMTAIVTAPRTPVGSVQFLVDGVASGAPLVLDPDGLVQAIITTDLAEGTHTIRADFLP